MAEQIVLTDLVNLQNETTAVNAINSNNTTIEEAFLDVLSLSGTAPNQMQSQLDMNSNPILNLPTPISQSSPVRLADLTEFEQFQNSVDLSIALAQAQTYSENSATSATSSAGSATSSAASATAAAASATAAGQLVLSTTGRLTLVSGVPVTTSDVAGATTIYFTPVENSNVTIFNGTNWVTHTFSEIALALDSTTSDPGYIASNNAYDVFAYWTGTAVGIGTGPAWSNLNSRGTGAGTTQISLLNGKWVNANSITLRYGSAPGNTTTVAAQLATYLGSFRASANGQATDSQQFRLLFNNYQPAIRRLFRVEPSAFWSWSTAAWHPVNANSQNAVVVFNGMPAGMTVSLTQGALAQGTAEGQTVAISISTNATSPDSVSAQGSIIANATYLPFSLSYNSVPGLGQTIYTMMELGNGSGTQSFYGSSSYAYLLGTVPM